MMGDLSINCPACGSNPHEECRMPGMGNHKAIDCLVNPVAADSRMDDMTEPETKLEHIEEGHSSMMIRRSFEKAWNIVKAENPDSDHDEPDDSPYAGTSKCPCRQGFNSCDHPKCKEAHSKNPNSKSYRGD